MNSYTQLRSCLGMIREASIVSCFNANIFLVLSGLIIGEDSLLTNQVCRVAVPELVLHTICTFWSSLLRRGSNACECEKRSRRQLLRRNWSTKLTCSDGDIEYWNVSAEGGVRC